MKHINFTQSTHSPARIISFVCITFLCGCTPDSSRNSEVTSPDQIFVQPVVPPVIAARNTDDIDRAITILLRQSLASQGSIENGKPLSLSALPLLRDAPAGQRFNMLKSPRVLVMGEPAARCPSLIPATGAEAATAAQAGLRACFAELGRRASDDCGCRIIAQDNRILAPRENFTYATSQLVRVFRNGKLDPNFYLAREQTNPGGTVTGISIGDRLVWQLSEDAEGRLSLRTASSSDSLPTSARRETIGLVRGRFQSVVTATGSDGARLRMVFGT